jgi:hypothetical protein
MELVITSGAPAFNTEAITKGDLIRAQYSAWDEARNGQVVSVTAEEIRVIWQPGIRNVTNYFAIYAEEAAAGLWSVKWTPDMETVHTYEPPAEDATDGDSGIEA